MNLLYWLFAVKVSLCNCLSEQHKSGFERGKPQYKITKIGQFPPEISESSGLAQVKGRNTFWTHNDGGNMPELFEVEQSGKIISKVPLPNLRNEDWEDLAEDQAGNLFIADIGNNNNSRQNLVIYKINPNKPDDFQTIHFKYTDQTAFPPQLNAKNFDCEAVVYQKEKLYLFSKNRSLTNHYVKLYELPAVAGNYSVSPRDSIFIKSMVTSAAISPDQSTLALLSYGKIFLFDISTGLNFKKPKLCIKIGKGQAEAILFINNQDFIITNEHKRNLYLVKKR